MITVRLGAMFPVLRRQAEYQNLLRTGPTFREAQRTVYGIAMGDMRGLIARIDSTLTR